MTDLNRGLSEVPGLIAERRRYEAWLVALEQRRESTPAHVFERVQSDYRTRLQRVSAELASHRQAIEEERNSLESRLALLEAEEQMRRDERAELDLRSHVGELEGEDSLAAFGAVDEAIEHLVGEKGGLKAKISELEALLEPVETAAVVGSTADTAGETPQESTAPADAAPSAATAPESSGASALEADEHAVAEEATEPPAARAAAAPSTNGEPARAASANAESGTFDELKFLDTVIGKDLPKPRSSRPSGAIREELGPSPLGGSVGNGPGGPRPAVVDQAKTLKCAECGASNYPTEWYCERCGAELAAL